MQIGITLKNISEIESAEWNLLQVYLCRRQYYPKIHQDDLKKLQEIIRMQGKQVFIHASLLYNLAGSVDGKLNPEKYRQNRNHTLTSLSQELDLAVYIGASGVVVHMAACRDEVFGYAEMVANLRTVIDLPSIYTNKLATEMGLSLAEFLARRRILLENSAHEGNKLGYTAKDINLLLSQLDDRFNLCLDTAHLFAAGECNVAEEIPIHFPVNRIKLVHLNDTQVKFGSRRDRHEHLGKGYVFQGKTAEKFFRWLEENQIPAILETGSDYQLDLTWLEKNLTINWKV